jgi:hypothetical protein
MQQHPNRTTDPLLGKMWKTKSARFNAHARLKAKHSLSTTATAILSFYLVIAALIPLVYESNMPPGGPKFLSVVSLVISIFLIIVTLLESAKNYSGEAEKMHKCALQISELYNRFQALSLEEADRDRISINGLYSEILKKHELNHLDIDFVRFEIMFWTSLSLSKKAVAFALVRYLLLWITEFWLYIVLIAAPPVVAYIYRAEVGL